MTAYQPALKLKDKYPTLKDAVIEIPAEWSTVVDQLIRALYENGFDDATDSIAVIKEKFGELRVYIEGCTNAAKDSKFDELIEQANKRAQQCLTWQVIGR